MKQNWKVGTIVLACLVMVGCRPGESERLADMADRTVQMQAEQNTAAANAHRELASLGAQQQTERNLLNQQFETLDKDRRDLHQLRRSELAWSESFRFLAIVIAATMPLFLCAYLIWGASRQPLCYESVNELLIRELVSPKPRLIAAPNLNSIDDKSAERPSNSKRKPKGDK